MSNRHRACTVSGCESAAVPGSRTVRCLPHLAGHPAATELRRPDGSVWGHLDPRPNPAAPAVQVRTDARDTSRRAALRALPSSGTARARVLDALRAAGELGATDEQLQASTGLPASTERPRRVELVQQGWAADSGQRRPSATGSPSAVWRYVP